MAATVQVQVTDLTGSVTVLEMQRNFPLQALRRRVEEVLSVPSGEQCFIVGEALVTNATPLASHVVDDAISLQLIKCMPPLKVLITVCWTGMYGGPESIWCYLPRSLNIHDVCCAALAPLGRGPFGCHIYGGAVRGGLPITSLGLDQTVSEALADGGELHIKWFGDKANSESSVTIDPSVGNYDSLDSSSSGCSCTVPAPEGHLLVRMSGFRSSFRGAFPPNACVQDVLESAPYHQPMYKGYKGGPLEKAEPLDRSKMLADLSVDGVVSLVTLGDTFDSPREEWRVVMK